MEAIRFEHDTLSLLDQTQLPAREVWQSYCAPAPVADAIARLAVRGAPAIGIAAAYAYALAARPLSDAAPDERARVLRAAKERLAMSRPTAVNLFWALDRMERRLLALSDADGATVYAALLDEASAIHREDAAMCRAMGAHGATLVPPEGRILTHCNAGALATGGTGTALAVVRAAHQQGMLRMVYCGETRPLLQGARLTAWELTRDGVPATLLTDSMAGSLMASGRVDLVLVGCDRMAANGDFANKIGTYSIAVLARHHGIPFYPVLPFSTIDLSLPDGGMIPIEERGPEEVTRFAGVQTAPEEVPVWNPAFDVTPHALVTAIITDRGVVTPPFDQGLRALRDGPSPA